MLPLVTRWQMNSLHYNIFERIRQVFGDGVWRDPFISQILLGSVSIPSFNQYRPSTSGIQTAFDVFGAVADHPGGRKVDIVCLSRLQNHAGLWFSTITAFIGAMGTIKDIRDFSPGGCDFPAHSPVYVVKRFQGNHPPPHGRLIRYHDDGEPIFSQLSNGVETAGQKPEFVPAFDVVWRIGVDDTVPVEEDDLFDVLGDFRPPLLRHQNRIRKPPLS